VDDSRPGKVPQLSGQARYPETGLHRYAILLAAFALLLIVSGASLTNARMTLPGAGTDGFFSEQLHQDAGISMGILTLVLAVWLMRGDRPGWLRRFGWVSLAAVAADAVIGMPGVLQSAPRAFGILHACLSQLFFAALVAITVFTSQSWSRGPEAVEDQGWPSLRSLSIATPILVFSQVTLGAALRHKSLGVTPHVISAMIVAFMVLAVGIFVTQQFPHHRSLRPAAVALMTVTLTQVLLGISALMTRMVGGAGDLPVRIATVTHVATGALTLAASIVVGILIRRHVRAAAPHAADSSATAVTP
jgi:cytochrome c oxidase assembly protein subunit 15